MTSQIKSDLDRIGIFQEMNYLHGTEYTPMKVSFNEASHKDKQFEYQDNKLKAANQDGYFGKEFQRLFEGEGYDDPIRRRRMFRLEDAKKNRPIIFKPSSPTKQRCGAGNIYGTFDEYNKERIPSFSPCTKEFEAVKCGKNVLVSPAQKGSGYGYPNVTITKMPPYFLEGEYEKLKDIKVEVPQIHPETGEKERVFYLPSRQGECFDANPFFTKTPMPLYREREKFTHIDTPFIPPSSTKQDGGGTGGCINPFPKYSASPYSDKVVIGRSNKEQMNSSNKLFRPVPGIKPYPISSIVDVGVKKVMNSNNCKAIKGAVYCKK